MKKKSPFPLVVAACARWLAATLIFIVPYHAMAQALVAPVGGEAVTLGVHRTLCSGPNELGGWRLGPGGQKLYPPDANSVPGTLDVHVAPSFALCAQSNAMLRLISVPFWPEVNAASLAVNVDAGRVDVLGTGLKNVVLRWRVGDASGTDVCRDPQTSSQGESCAFRIDRGLSADPSLWSLVLLPEGIEQGGDMSAFDAHGKALALSRFQMHPNKIVIIDLIQPDASLDVEADVGRILLRHPEAVARVECRDGTCELEKQDLIVRGAKAADETFDVRAVLRPNVFLQGATQLQSAPLLAVPLQRCPLSLASSAPLRGMAGQRLVASVGGRCQEIGQLKFFVGAVQARQVISHKEGDRTLVVLSTDAVLGDELSLVVQYRNATAGVIRAKTKQMPNTYARIELPGYGPIDFIPSNRDAEVVLPSMGPGGSLVPTPVEGVYTVKFDPAGTPKIRGVPGATGWIALRLAYRDQSLPAALRDTNLADFADTVDRNIHSASIPISIGASANSNQPLVELLCEKPDKNTERIVPGRPTSIPYDHKDACRLVLHRERLAPEDGDQMVRITASVAALDGVNRPEASVDQRLVLRPGSEPRILWLTGVVAPFDRMVVRVGVVTEDLHDAVAQVSQAERVTSPQLQWALTMGTSRFRLYATTALPTGLFRVADSRHSGLMGLNAGILARLVVLGRNGIQAPVGLEMGAMVLGITGDSRPAPNGHVAAVGGLSLSVPIANVSRMTQASISLHIWGEYEVSRALMERAGTPWGFVFGPSLSFGDVGVNL